MPDHKALPFKIILSLLVLLTIFSPGDAMAQDDAPQNIIMVTSSANSGPGTLREALEFAQSGDTINFDPAVFPLDNPTTIWVESQLPFLYAGNVTIDAKDAGVILDGSLIPEERGEGSTSGIWLESNNNTILGLQILNFPGNAIVIWYGSGNQIGGARPAGAQSCIYPCNLLSGNGGSGVMIERGDNNIIQGNFMGTDITGTEAFGNTMNGVRVIASAENMIGGYEDGESNLLCDSGFGIEILDEGANNNQVIGNHIGVDITGTKTIGNLVYGGGSAAYNNYGNLIENNIISGNEAGFSFSDGVHDNIFRNNYVGTNADLSPDMRNEGTGLIIIDTYNNTIGPGNVIMYNNPIGMFVQGEISTGNRFTQNTIAYNAVTNIEIVVNVNAPDPPYDLTASTKEVMGFAEKETEIEIYTGSRPGSGRYIGTTNTGQDGIFLWDVPRNVELDRYVTALAYAEDGTTSEFAHAVEVILEPEIVIAELPGTLDPSQISTDPQVLRTNGFFAFGFLLYLGIVVMLFDKTFENYGDIFEEKILTPIKGFFSKIIPTRRQTNGFIQKITQNIWVNWVVLLLLVASIQTLLDIQLSTIYDWASLALTIFIATVIVSGIQILNEQFIRRQIEQPTDKELTNVRWAGVAMAAITMLFSRGIKFQPGFVLGAVEPFHYEPEIEDSRQEGARIFATKLSVFVITFMGWLIAGRVGVFSPGLRNLLVMCFTIALEGFFIELLPISKLFDGAILAKWNIFAWLGLYLPIIYFALWLVFNPYGDSVHAVQQNSMQALLIVMAFIMVALLLVTLLGRLLTKKEKV